MSPQPEDHDRTVIRPVGSAMSGGAELPPRDDDDDDTHALSAGTVLGEFELTRKIGEGGFSIVYTAQDLSLGRCVALKEYMPASIAARKGRTMVSARSERHKDTFEAGLKSFINEAKLLAQFDHRSLVKVYRFWEANGTAYMIMPFYQGVTLKDTVHGMAQPPDEAWLRKMLGPLTEALSVIHAEHCYHRDIAPDNVLLLKDDDDRPLLLDFGAARKVIGGMTQALTVILKPGYAPVEQYAESPDMKQGSWTDVYALAATVYWTITGKTPPPAVGRMLGDTYKPLAECAAGRYSERFLQAIDRALAVRPEQRTQTIQAFRQDIGLEGGSSEPEARVAPQAVVPAKDKAQVTAPVTAAPRRSLVWAVAGATIVLAVALGGWWAMQPVVDTSTAKVSPVVETAPAKPAVNASPVLTTEPPSPVASAVTPSPATAEALEIQAPIPIARPPTTKPLPKASATAKASSGNSAECGRVLQRISLGDSSPELLAKLDSLKCK